MNTAPSIWEDQETLLTIKEIYGKSLNAGEWKTFIGIGTATGLNPFLREIWAIKYGNNPATIIIGRDGYRVSAQRHHEYEYHQSVAVYENDLFEMRNGEINHIGKIKDRGSLVGAYCFVKKKSSDKIIQFYADLEEFDKKQSNWKTMPSLMIRKCAEANALRAVFQEQFGGTYSEDEYEAPSRASTLVDNLNLMKNRYGNATQNTSVVINSADQMAGQETGEVFNEMGENTISENEVSSDTQESPLTIDQLTAIQDLMRDKKFSIERKNKALEYFKVNTFEALTAEQAGTFIMQLEKL